MKYHLQTASRVVLSSPRLFFRISQSQNLKTGEKISRFYDMEVLVPFFKQ